MLARNSDEMKQLAIKRVRICCINEGAKRIVVVDGHVANVGFVGVDELDDGLEIVRVASTGLRFCEVERRRCLLRTLVVTLMEQSSTLGAALTSVPQVRTWQSIPPHWMEWPSQSAGWRLFKLVQAWKDRREACSLKRDQEALEDLWCRMAYLS